MSWARVCPRSHLAAMHVGSGSLGVDARAGDGDGLVVSDEPSGGDENRRAGADVAPATGERVRLTGQLQGRVDLGSGSLAQVGTSDVFVAELVAAAEMWGGRGRSTSNAVRTGAARPGAVRCLALVGGLDPAYSCCMDFSRETTTRWLAAACAATLVLDPAIVRAQAPDSGIDSVQLRRDRGRKLLISGGVIGGVGLLATTIGFGVLAGMHASNPGVGKEFVLGPGQDERSILRLANGMEMAGMIGASMLLTGIVLAAVGGHTLRQTRTSRFSAGFGPRSVNLVFRF